MAEGRYLGPRAAADLVVPAGINGGGVLAFMMRNKKTAEEMLRTIASAIGAKNEELAQKWGRFTLITDAPYAYYGAGISGTSETPEKSEFKQAEPIRSDSSGHGLPFSYKEDALGWTQEYLEDAHEVQLMSDVSLIVQRWENKVDRGIFDRMFSNAYVTIPMGVSVPWAIGNGSIPYIPQQYGGYSFDATHTHFKFKSGTWNAANAKELLELMVTDLIHHGINGRLTAFVSMTDVAIYKAMTGFVHFIPGDVQVIGGNTNAPVYVSNNKELQGSPGEMFGFYVSDKGPVVELRHSERIPTKYAWMGKSYGVDHTQNPIAIRIHPNHPFGLSMNVELTSTINPEMKKVLVKGGHGVGVNWLLNGVAGQGEAASYTPPTIS